MAVIFSTNSARDLVGAAIVHSGAAQARATGYATEDVRVDVTGGGVNPVELPLANATGTLLWTHFRAKLPTENLPAAADGSFVEILSSAGGFIGGIDFVDGNLRANSFYIYGSGWYPPRDTVLTFDIYCSSNGTNIVTELYVDGILRSTSTRAQSAAAPRRVILTHDDMVSAPGSVYYSEFLVDDSDSTLGCRVAEMRPASDGTYSQWEGDYTDLLSGSDDDELATDTAARRQSWNPAAYGGSGALDVRSVIAVAEVVTGSAAPDKITQFLRKGGSNYDATERTLAPGTVTTIRDSWTTDPSDGLPWTPADLSSLEVGLLSGT